MLPDSLHTGRKSFPRIYIVSHKPQSFLSSRTLQEVHGKVELDGKYGVGMGLAVKLPIKNARIPQPSVCGFDPQPQVLTLAS